MGEVLDFIGRYWWLAVVLAGAAGGIMIGFARLSARRHERRLAAIKTTTDLRAVRMDDGPEPRALTRPSPLPDQLAKAFAAHDAVTARWRAYPLDHPSMSDPHNDLTAGFLRAKKVAELLRPASVDAKVSLERLADYRAAVTDYERAFDLAERAHLNTPHPPSLPLPLAANHQLAPESPLSSRE